VQLSAFASDPQAQSQSAYTLYAQHNYAASADAFEALIRSSAPNARLYYYAVLANRACNRGARARQLSQYIVSNFSGSTEASYAAKLYPDTAARTASAADAVPDSLKGKNIQELMKTEEGRKVVEEAIARKEAATAAASAKVSPMLALSKGKRLGERVFTASDIARDGAGGIDQMYYPNCWFESSMSALAMLPRGQKLMADMVRYGDKEGTYIVRFPGDGAEYKINEEDLEKTGIHNKALWATLIESGQTLKFPNDAGGQLSEGLGCLTGQRAETLSPSAASDQELSSFIHGAVKSQSPIICGSQWNMSGLPRLAVPSHAYTIIDFDPASGMIKLRNPHGKNSERFTLKNDDNHQKFEQLDDGVFKMHISLFKMYFAQVARAFI
jgi:Calpain family cysteine protease